MSDPSLVQISFKIRPEMPKDMKRFILSAFTDYYETYYPNKKVEHEEYLQLMEKYPAISDMQRNDAYHNVDFQICKLNIYDLYDLDTLEILDDKWHWLNKNGNEIPNDTPYIGVCITSLPRRYDTIDEFLKLVGPYITSEVCTLGICHNYDYGKTVAYYYMDKLGNIKKHMIQRAPEDEVLFDNGLTKLNARKAEIIKDIETTPKLSDEERQMLLAEVDDYVNEEFKEDDE